MNKVYRFYSVVVFFTAAMLLMISPVAAENNDQSYDAKSARKILDDCRKCVFAVNAYTKVKNTEPQAEGEKKEFKWQRNIGTAIPIDSQGHLITLTNVIDKAEKIIIVTDTGEKTRAQLIGADQTGFISVLKIEDRFISYIPEMISCHSMIPGDTVFFLGVVPGMSLDVRKGSIENVNTTDGTFEVKSLSNPGTSGTPVFDRNENVLGLLAYRVDSGAASANDSTTSFLSVSLEHAFILAQQVINKKEPKCGWLGVCVDFTNPQTNGIIITNIIEGSPADRSKLKPNDKIFEYNGFPVRSIREFSDAFTKTKAGETVALKILRGDSLMSVDITLKEIER